MHRLTDDHSLEQALAAWAVRPETVEARADAVVASALAALDRAETAEPRFLARWRPALGVALAASIALGAVLIPGMREQPSVSAPQTTVAMNDAPVEAHAEAFGLLFTPTPEEEEYL